MTTKTPTIPVGFTVQGLFRCILRERDETVAQDTGWFSNLITDTGMERIKISPGYAYGLIGSSNTAPAVTDTKMGTYLAGPISDALSPTIGFRTTPQRHGYGQYNWRFDTGVGTGTVREVGATNTNSSSSYLLSSRALVADSGGTPMEIVKGADQILDVYHERRVIVKLTDWTGIVDISGVNYDVIIRAGRAYTARESFGGGPVALWDPTSGISPNVGFSPGLAYATDIDPNVWGYPSGTGVAATGETSTTVIDDGTWYETTQIEVLLDGFNVVGGIRSIFLPAGCSSWQVQFDPVVPKTNEKRLRLNFKFTYARA